MEQGSLLEQALRKSVGQEESSDIEHPKNTLLLDVYPLRRWHLNQQHQSYGGIEYLLYLAELAEKCNSYVKTRCKYHWHYGGDGPIFGVHLGDEGIPHLRALVQYGPSVADEWVAVEITMEMSEVLEDDVAISCWDVEDGQVILIQTADALPDWLDQDPTDDHRYTCWIRDGKVQLLQESHISLSDALKRLQSQDRTFGPSHSKVQNFLEHCLSKNREHAFAKQVTPLVVPRKIATMIRSRPDLVHAAIQAFCDHIDESCPDLMSYDDWVWTTASISRTNYAMLRTMVSSEWSSSDFVPPISVEVKRYKRQCKMESTPHIRHAVALGVRLVAGVEFLSRTKWSIMSVEQRISCWSHIEAQSGNNGTIILSNYQQGPNHTQYDLTQILKCPVFPQEGGNPTLYSHPQTSIKQQMLDAQKSVNPNEEFPMPLAGQVDDETWMMLDEDGGLEGASDLDRILSRFQNFMVQPAEVEGVTATGAKPKTRRDIRPRVVMNMLHTVLKGGQLAFPKAEDPFFYREDYNLMEESDDDDENGLEQRDTVTGIQGAMDAMDMELEQKSKSRDLSEVTKSEISGENYVPGQRQSREVAENAHVLSNLLQSLEASSGESGPVPNMLKGMGSEPSKDLS